MPNYIPYRDNIETIDPDERETHAKIIQTMTDGQHISREKYGKSVRIPATPGLFALEQQKFDPQTPDALREATVACAKGTKQFAPRRSVAPLTWSQAPLQRTPRSDAATR